MLTIETEMHIFKLIHLFMQMDVLPVCMSIHHICVEPMEDRMGQ